MWTTHLLVLHGIIFTVCTLFLWLAGDTHVLAGSKRSGIRDVARLNRWAGNRFLILPVIAFAMAWRSADDVAAGIQGIMYLWAAAFGVVIWISIGSKRF